MEAKNSRALNDGLVITEGVEGYFHYHLSHPDKRTRGLCGKQVMSTMIPLEAWGSIAHLRERWCDECASKGGIKCTANEKANED